MKISILLIFISAFNLLAKPGYSQSEKISLKLTNLNTIENVILEIERTTDYVFIYNEDVISTLNNEVNVEVTDQSLDEILNLLLEGTDLAYSLSSKQVTLYKDESKKVYTQITSAAPLAVQQPSGKTVTGRVADIGGEPLPGVTVLIKGSSQGTVTDVDGKFMLTDISEDATLQFSFVGMKTQEVLVGNQATIDISLEEESIGLDEVIAVGYGTMRKSDLTGSVASVSTETIRDRPIVSAAQAIAGQLSGVQVQQVSGMPGSEGMSIRVRGTGSITQSNEPLYVVDGYPMEESAFRMISPSNIESIEVLKDASSTAIYGSRGANGVIIITTKKGDGKPTVNVNIYAGFQQPEKYFDLLNKDQYLDWFIDGRNNAWLDASVISSDPDQSPHTINDPNSRRELYPSAGSQYIIPDGKGSYLYDFLDPASVAKMPDTDWQRELFRNAIIQNYEVTLSGSSEKTQYLFSASYIDQAGIVINSNFDRINLSTNITSKLSDRLTVGLNMNSFFSTTNEQVEGKYSPIQIALQQPPIYPVRNDDGSYGSMVRNYEILPGDAASPIGMADEILTKRRRYGWMGVLFAELEILKGLKYKISINGSVQDNNRKYYLPSYVDMDASRAPRLAEGQNDKRSHKDWVVENTLTYNKTFSEKHNLTALVGYTAQKNYYDRLYGEARGFPNDKITTLNAGNMYNLTSTESDYSMISYLGRLNYAYDNKYLLAVAARRDGSSRFGRDNKWGSFPSLSFAWRISQEQFMHEINLISDLKLRASYGISGNNRIGDYSSVGLLNIGYYPTGDVLRNTVDPSTMPNNDLGWEKTRQVNLGFDISLLNNRIALVGDFYNSESLELLLNVPVPTITGYTSQMQNVGKVENKGMEFLLSTKNFVDEFKWSTDFNINFNRNKVLELGPDSRPIFASAPNASNAFITQIGHPVASYYGYVFEGVFMSQEELDKYPHLSKDQVGDGRYRDINNDGVIDANDRTILGDNHPKFTGGLNNNFSYKNWDLGIQFTGSYGAEVFSIYKRMIAVYHGDRNAMVDVLDRWRSPEDPGNGQEIRPSRTPHGYSRSPSSHWLTDASYLRLRNVSLSYTFDSNKINKFGMENLRLYLTGSNLYTWTKNPGYDPEASSEGSGLTRGGDYIGYPSARSFILGLNISF